MPTFNLSFPVGVTDSPLVAIPNGTTGCTVSMTSTGWPAGTYQLDIFLSEDNGTTFPRSASMTMVSPPPIFHGGSPPWRMSFEVDALHPNQAKARITAPSAFNSTVTITPSS